MALRFTYTSRLKGLLASVDCTATTL
jgi:hypothetical protein